MVVLHRIVIVLATFAAATANAAEVKVISAGAVRSVVGGMIDAYASKSGVKFTFTTGSTGVLRKIIASGEPADLIIASGPLMAELEATGKMTPGSRVDLGRIGLGVVVRDGATAPNVSTPDSLKRALIAAKSIAYTDPARGGTSTLHLMKIAEQFGIAAEVKTKGVFATGGNDAVAKVGEGKAEIAVVLISEVSAAKGARLAGPLPKELQLYTIYAAAIPLSSTDPANARALVTELISPTLRKRWEEAGWEPAR
jgi:molybdate transport system substrate-binding protein